MPDEHMTLRPATADDLEAVNRVIENAVMTWDLPDRVKRLASPATSTVFRTLGRWR